MLKRLVSVIRFLASRGLPFCGSNNHIGNANNGNYLGLLELVSEYDKFLETHNSKYANKGRGHVSYLSTTIANELANGFLEFLANTGHKGKEMETEVVEYFETKKINIMDCRGQSYDTAKNMSEKYKGLQEARIKQIKFVGNISLIIIKLN